MKNDKLEKAVKEVIAKSVCADLEAAAKNDIEIIAEDENLINYLEELRNSPKYKFTDESVLKDALYDVVEVCICEKVYLMKEIPNAFEPSIVYSLYNKHQLAEQNEKIRKIVCSKK